MDIKYLFRSMEEQPTPITTSVTGRIPDWLNGILLKIGPAKFDLGNFTVKHWFDGYAMLYNFVIRDKKVTYCCKFLKSEAYEKAMQFHKPVYTEFGTKAYGDPSKNVFSRLFSKLIPTDITDNDAINVYPLSNELYCSTESCHLWRVDPLTLDTVDKVDMNKTVGINLACAHMHVASDGIGYNIASSFLTGLKYHVVKTLPTTTLKKSFEKGSLAFCDSCILTNISSRWTSAFSFCHSFGLSQNYIVFIEQPLLINSLKLATIKIKGRSYRDCLEWHPQEKCRFVVIEKASGNVSKMSYFSDAFFFFHHINTYEEDGYLVTDIITYRNIDVMDMYFLCNFRDKPYPGAEPPRAQRFVLPLGCKADGIAGTNLVNLEYTSAKAEKHHDGSIYLTAENLAEPGFELPKINYTKYNGRKYTYVYGSGCFEPGFYRNSVCKINVQTKAITLWRHCDNCFPGEAVFVSRPGAVEEDDGVLLSVAVDRRAEVPDFLVMLDARTMKEIARAEVPVDVPALLHGCFIYEE